MPRLSGLISLPFLQDNDVKIPNFMFYRGRKQEMTKFTSLCEHG